MKSVIVDCRIPYECERNLNKMGYRVIKLRANGALPSSLSSHTDMLLFSFSDEIVSTADYCDTVPDVFEDIHRYHKNVKLTFTSDKLKSAYPDDCKMNALKMGRDVFIREQSVSPYLKSAAQNRGYRLQRVKQGYPACTVLALSESAAITADEGMAKALEKAGKRVYRISNGGITLPPYEYGFIGGAAFSDGDKIFFFGDFRMHPNCNIILEACKNEGKEAVSLSASLLADLGGAIVI